LDKEITTKFLSHLHLDPDLGILEGIFHRRIGEIQHILLVTQEVADKFL